MFYPALLYFLWSLGFPIGKKLLEISPPIFLTGARMLLGAFLLFVFIFIFQRKSIQKISTRGWLALAILGFFSIFITNILEFWSLQHLSSAKTCFLYSLSPFLTAVLSYFHFNEKMTPKKWLGVIIGIFGFTPVLISSSEESGNFSSLFAISLPEISMLAAVFFSVYGWIILRMLVKNEKISPPVANAISMLIGGLLSILASFAVDIWNPLPIVDGKGLTFMGILFSLTVLSNVICYNLYGHLSKKYTATLLSFFGMLSPIFTSIHGYFILGEPISLLIILSTATLLLGLKLVYDEELKLGYLNKNIKTSA
jgi:drug/metabolite transporter (DMT)-like permease